MTKPNPVSPEVLRPHAAQANKDACVRTQPPALASHAAPLLPPKTTSGAAPPSERVVGLRPVGALFGNVLARARPN